MNRYKVAPEMKRATLFSGAFASVVKGCGKVFPSAFVPVVAVLLFGAASLPGFGQTAPGKATDSATDNSGASKPDVVVNTGKGSKNFWANWLEAHRRVTHATATSKKNGNQVYAKAFADAAATPTTGADAAPEPAPGPEPIGPVVGKETDAAKEIQILKDRLDKLQKVIDEQAPGGANAPAAPAPPLKIPEPLSAPDPAPANDKDTPFAYGDQSWFNGSPRNSPLVDTKFFTGEVRFDTHFMEDFNQPKDHTMGGATESFRSGEFQVEQISFGGDFHYDNVRGRVLTMYGLFATTTPATTVAPASANGMSVTPTNTFRKPTAGTTSTWGTG